MSLSTSTFQDLLCTTKRSWEEAQRLYRMTHHERASRLAAHAVERFTDDVEEAEGLAYESGYLIGEEEIACPELLRGRPSLAAAHERGRADALQDAIDFDRANAIAEAGFDPTWRK